MELIRRAAGTVFAAAAFVLAAAVTPAATASALDPAPYLHPQRLVDIGGRRLNLYCAGFGSPAVVFEAGLGDSIDTWDDVLPVLARRTRVCAYDRAGMGFSDPSATHRDADGIAADLHALVTRARIPTPFVLVGHSIAGLYTRVYTDRYPQDVAGLVLVDPSAPDQNAAFRRIVPLSAPQAPSDAVCLDAVARGTLRPGTRFAMACGIPSPAAFAAMCRTEPAARCAIDTLDRRQTLRRSYGRTLGAETRAFASDVSSAEVVREQRRWGALPLIVLTGARTAAAFPVGTAADRRALQAVWTHLHDRVTALSTRGVNFIIAGAGHYIQHDRPAAVVSAVDKVVDEVRYRR